MAKNKDNKKAFLWIGLGGLLLFGMGGRARGEGAGAGGGAGKPISDASLQSAFNKAKSTFGDYWAKYAEKIYRKETRHFDSGQFRQTYTAGMEGVKGKNEFPFGWSSLTTFLNEYPQYKGNYSLIAMSENTTGITKQFIVFPSLESAVMFLAWTIKKRGNPGYWRAWDEAIAQDYKADLDKISTKFV